MDLFGENEDKEFEEMLLAKIQNYVDTSNKVNSMINSQERDSTGELYSKHRIVNDIYASISINQKGRLKEKVFSDISGYLDIVLRNTMITNFKYNGRSKEMFISIENHDIEEFYSGNIIQESFKSQFSKYDYEDLLDRIDDILNSEEKIIFTLGFIKDLSIDEISKRLEESRGVILQKISVIKNKLKNRLK